MKTEKLTPMQEFALNILKQWKGGEVSASYIAGRWSEFKTGRSRGASRDMFGYISAAYRACRSLVEKGLAESIRYRMGENFKFVKQTSKK